MLLQSLTLCCFREGETGWWGRGEQTRVCLIWPCSSSSFPILFTCMEDLNGASVCGCVCVPVCLHMKQGVQGVEKGTADITPPPQRQQTDKRGTSHSYPHSEIRPLWISWCLHIQTCHAHFGSRSLCGFSCRPLRPEDRCLNLLTRNSVLTPNAAVSRTLLS